MESCHFSLKDGPGDPSYVGNMQSLGSMFPKKELVENTAGALLLSGFAVTLERQSLGDRRAL
jgi:hypothetical protein